MDPEAAAEYAEGLEKDLVGARRSIVSAETRWSATYFTIQLERVLLYPVSSALS